MHPKIRMFLATRDDAYRRNDPGIVRSMNAELRRLGIPDEATLQNPNGRRSLGRRIREETAPAKSPGRPKLPRCEHENIADRCPECNPELVAH